MAFAGYYIKINGNDFTNPTPSKYRLYPKIIQDMDSERTASGQLHRNILPHHPPKIELEFPPMTFAQFREYHSVIDADVLDVEYYDYASDSYQTWNMYHNDIVIEEINTQGQEHYIDRWAVNLIGY